MHVSVYETIPLHSDAVLVVARRSNLAQIEVQHGTVWVTSSPADGDMLLHGGDRFAFGDRWPYVMQALGNARISLQ